jgi:isopenicillin N synthase-like dioxygenase
MDNIPVIDFGAFDSDPTAVAKAIREACETIGFFFLKNVGIPQPEIDQVFELVSPLLFLSLSLSN